MVELTFDIEANAKDPNDVTMVWCIVTQDTTTKEVKKYHDYVAIAERDGTIEQGVDALLAADKTWSHYGISYDIPVLKRIHGARFDYNKVGDTLVVSSLLFPDRYNGHSVAAWGEKLGHSKVEHNEWSNFSKAMLHRCVEDVKIQSRILNSLRMEAQGHDWRESLDTEHKIARVMYNQAKAGFYFDEALAHKHLETLDKLISDTHDKVYPLMPDRLLRVAEDVPKHTMDGKVASRFKKYTEQPLTQMISTRLDEEGRRFSTFEIFEAANINSRPQLIETLKPFGWKPVNLTDKGNPKLDLESIEAMDSTFAGKDELIGWFTYKSRRAQIQNKKDASKGWLGKMKGSRISADAIALATNTGRMAHINVVNVPNKDAIFGPEVRKLFSAPQGRVLVCVDFNSLEYRILAHYLNDDDFTHAIVNGDPHQANADKMGVGDRGIAKRIGFGILYGQGFKSLAAQLEVSHEEAQRLIALFYGALPTLEGFIKKCRKASARGYMITVDGRKVYIRTKDGKIKEYTALNTLIQSSGSAVVKKATVMLDEMVRKEGLDAFQVCHMHDEFIYESSTKDAKRVAILQKQCIIDTSDYYNLRCPLEGDAQIGQTWLEVH